MRQFLIETILFAILFTVFVAVLLWFVPNNKIKNNSLFSNIDKHHRLDSLASPKIVFVGGSNLAFGLNSQLIEDSLKLPVVNMGLHAGFGLKYMLSEVGSRINKGDIVIVTPEYQQFLDNLYLGEKVLIALLFDVDKHNLSFLSFSHFVKLFPQMTKYGVSKLFYKKLDVMDDGGGNEFVRNFNRNSFNKYGDIVLHWNYPNELINPIAQSDKEVKVNLKSVEILAKFKTDMESRGARVFIMPPSLQNSSYKNLASTVSKIEDSLHSHNLYFSIKTSEFAYPDSLFFNTVYHLNKEGLDMRSGKIIEFLKDKF